MRKWLFLLLLVVLPLQFAWSAAAGYCGHEAGTGTPHFGHHEHKSVRALGDKSKDTKLKTLADGDSGCIGCHLSPLQPTSDTTPQLAAEAAARPALANPSKFRSHIPIGLERPDRSLAV